MFFSQVVRIAAALGLAFANLAGFSQLVESSHSKQSASEPKAASSLAPSVTLYYVDGFNGSDVTGTGTELLPWQTITYALSQVSGSGIEIHAAAATYDQALGEVFPLVMESGVSLIGAGYTNTVLSANGGLSRVVDFVSAQVYPTTTQLSGFKITNAWEAVRVEGVPGGGSTPTIQWNSIEGNGTGLSFLSDAGETSSAFVFENRLISNTVDGASSGSYGSLGSPAIMRAHFERNLIAGNTINGVYCTSTGQGDSTSNGYGLCAPVLISNTIINNGLDGVRCLTSNAGGCSPVMTANFIAFNDGWGLAARTSFRSVGLLPSAAGLP